VGRQHRGPLQTEGDALSQRIGWANKLLECAEAASPLGGVFLRPAWDADTAGDPLLTIVLADEAVPSFRFDMLHEVTFVRELPAPAGWMAIKDGEVWRHLEHHEPGLIRHELWLVTRRTSAGRLDGWAASVEQDADDEGVAVVDVPVALRAARRAARSPSGMTGTGTAPGFGRVIPLVGFRSIGPSGSWTR
jgi:hypothetical protein